MKINVEIPDEIIAAAMVAHGAGTNGTVTGQPLSGGAAPRTVAVGSIPPPAAGDALSAGPAEQQAGATEVSQHQDTALDGGAAPQ